MDKEELKIARKEVHKKAGNVAQIGIRLLFARMNPLCSLEKYNSILHTYIKEINPREGKFVGTKEELIQILDMMKWHNKGYYTVKAETTFVLSQFPELSLHESMIAEYIKNKRG